MNPLKVAYQADPKKIRKEQDRVAMRDWIIKRMDEKIDKRMEKKYGLKKDQT